MYSQILILLLGVSYALCASDARMIGGTVVPSSAFKFTVSIQYLGKHICAGVIIDGGVLTSANCVHNYKANQLTIREGSLDHSAGGFIRYVTNIKCNDKYNALDNSNDIALLEVAELSPSANRVTLATTPLKSGLEMLGWGEDEKTNEYSKQLKTVPIKLEEPKTCQDEFGTAMIGKTVTCSLSTNQTACAGDRGGPLVKGTVLYGIISFKDGCYSDATIFTNITAITYITECKKGN